jgi:TATA-binding protein-associated factor
MGTGKSIQALVAIGLAHVVGKHGSKHVTSTSQSMKTEASFRSLIVCPSTLVGHWDGEITKCFPPRSVFTSLCLTGCRAERVQKWSRKSRSVNIVIVSYAVLRSDIDYLEREDWCYCVLDEGHLLKNPKTGMCLISKFVPLIEWRRLLFHFLGSSHGFSY